MEDLVLVKEMKEEIGPNCFYIWPKLLDLAILDTLYSKRR